MLGIPRGRGRPWAHSKLPSSFHLLSAYFSPPPDSSPHSFWDGTYGLQGPIGSALCGLVPLAEGITAPPLGCRLARLDFFPCCFRGGGIEEEKFWPEPLGVVTPRWRWIIPHLGDKSLAGWPDRFNGLPDPAVGFWDCVPRPRKTTPRRFQRWLSNLRRFWGSGGALAGGGWGKPPHAPCKESHMRPFERRVSSVVYGRLNVEVPGRHAFWRALFCFCGRLHRFPARIGNHPPTLAGDVLGVGAAGVFFFGHYGWWIFFQFFSHDG